MSDTKPPHSSPALIRIIGGGPAGLMAAEVLCAAGHRVDLYDSMPSVGRKFLMAGKGGMNITHSEPYAQFVSRYGTAQQPLQPYLQAFTPEDLRHWLRGLGIDSFVGTSGRVFPTDMKAAPLLRQWLSRLKQQGLSVHTRHIWRGWHNGNPQELCFDTPHGAITLHSDLTILALGGGSWPQLGSTGSWVDYLRAAGISIQPLLPSNCGFKCRWSPFVQEHLAGQPLKNISASFSNSERQVVQQRGECIITQEGVEGGIIYALSAGLRQEIMAQGEVTLTLDLTPDLSLTDLLERLSVPRKKLSLSNYLRKRLKFDAVKTGLLREALSPLQLQHTGSLCQLIKALPITLTATQPLTEAISTAGGISFSALTPGLMLHTMPGVFCAGEMLDWEAPTGGYLLTACFATGRAAGLGALSWLAREI